MRVDSREFAAHAFGDGSRVYLCFEASKHGSENLHDQHDLHDLHDLHDQYQDV